MSHAVDALLLSDLLRQAYCMAVTPEVRHCFLVVCGALEGFPRLHASTGPWM